MGLEKKQFGIKDLIYFIGLVFSLSGMYYTMDARITLLESDQVTIRKTVEDNAKLTKTIYLGLIAKGVIDPPSN